MDQESNNKLAAILKHYDQLAKFKELKAKEEARTGYSPGEMQKQQELKRYEKAAKEQLHKKQEVQESIRDTLKKLDQKIKTDKKEADEAVLKGSLAVYRLIKNDSDLQHRANRIISSQRGSRFKDDFFCCLCGRRTSDGFLYYKPSETYIDRLISHLRVCCICHQNLKVMGIQVDANVYR